MQKLIDIFLQPRVVFGDLRAHPQPALPILILIVASTLGTTLYFQKVDLGWFMEQSILQSNPDISDAELARVRDNGGASEAIRWAAPLSSVIGLGAVFLILGLYYWLVGKVTAVALSFKESLALAGWSSMPTLLNSLLILIGTMNMESQTPLESLSLTTLDPLLIQLPLDHPWKTFATAFTFLVFWTTFLAALGWRELAGSARWTGAVTVAALPSVLIFGGMAVAAVL